MRPFWLSRGILRYVRDCIYLYAGLPTKSGLADAFDGAVLVIMP